MRIAGIVGDEVRPEHGAAAELAVRHANAAVDDIRFDPAPVGVVLIRAVRRQHRLIDAIEAPVAVGRGNRLHGFAADLDVLLDVFDARIAAERLGVVTRETGDEAVQRAREHAFDESDAMVARKRTRHFASARVRAAHAGGAVFHHDEIPVGRVARLAAQAFSALATRRLPE